MSCGIYRILNILTGKCYVGKSTDIEDRYNTHRIELKKNIHHAIKLQRSWNKYGEENFRLEILQECEVEMLAFLEAFWMAKLNSFHDGYNSKLVYLDGERIREKHSEETKMRMSSIAMGRPVSAEAKRKIGLAALGRKLSEETKKKLSEHFTGRTISEEQKLAISRANTGRKHTEEERRKIKEAWAKQAPRSAEAQKRASENCRKTWEAKAAARRVK